MFSFELRNKFLNFFKNKGHKILPSSSLIPENDPSVLLTTAGMQQFKSWFAGWQKPDYLRVATCQKCLRTSDVEEVGDEIHLTFFEMLGNFSFGDYFKKEAILWGLEFLMNDLKIGRNRILVTIFGGDRDIKEDNESFKILQNLKFKDFEIKKGNRKDNFWGPTGKEGPCGPTVEFYVDGVEIWNLVFNEFYQDKNKNLRPLTIKGVDTGMGLERALAILNRKKSVYESDVFIPLMLLISQQSKITDLRSFRIICDHLKAAVFLISDGVFPSNLEQGYILRRLIRRLMRYCFILKIKETEKLLEKLVRKVIEVYQNNYPELKQNENRILEEFKKEEERFGQTLERGLKEFQKITQSSLVNHRSSIKGKDAFYLYETYGFPLELTKELATEKKMKIEEKEFWEEFKKHQEISRAGVDKKFHGGLMEYNYEAIKLHTATHLLHQALREILGKEIRQMGSNINSERLRFDFSYPRKLTKEELKKIEDLVNQKINEQLEVKYQRMSYNEAIQKGALAFFRERYPEIVKVYEIGNFSKEVCGGPHVKNTRELGYFKIIKEESSSAGVRRIKAILVY